MYDIYFNINFKFFFGADINGDGTWVMQRKKK